MKKTEKKMIKTTVLSVSLPIELMSNILSKLPMKDIISFKTVSKAWNTLISSLHFSHQHLISQSQSSHFQDRIHVFVGQDKCLYYFNLNQISYSITPIKINLPGSYLFRDFIGSCNSCKLPEVLINNHLLHWVFFGVDDNEYCIIRSFDVCSEQWSQVPLPASNFERFLIKLVGFDGRLYFKTICDESSMFVMDVYGVKDSWVKLFDCFDEVFNDTHFVYPLSYSESRSEVFVELQFESRFYWCNLTEKTRREVKFHNVQPRGAGVECIRSLAHLPGCG